MYDSFQNRMFKKTGLEDERFFMYLDDIEFSNRVARKGYELLYVPRSIIFHKVFGEKESLSCILSTQSIVTDRTNK